MQVTETLSEGLKRAYTVVVPAADLESKRAARLANLTKTLTLPGFRPGKIPPNIVKQRYGTAVGAEVLEESVNEATQQVLSERGLRPAQQPKVDVVSLDHRQIGLQFRFNDDAVVTQFVREHAEHLGDNLVHIQESFDRHGLLEEGTNSPHDFGRRMPVPDDPVERRLSPLEIRRIVPQPRLTGVRIGHH